MRYVLARVITSPTGSLRTARLLVTDVPSGTTDTAVLAAIEAAGLAAEFSEAGVPFGNHELRADRRGWPFGITHITEAEAAAWAGPGRARPAGPVSVTWADLTRTPSKSEGKRITLRPSPSQHARYTLAAAGAGLSLDAWMHRAADLAAAAEINGYAPGRALTDGREILADQIARHQAAEVTA